MAQANNMAYIETSALDTTNVDTAFERVLAGTLVAHGARTPQRVSHCDSHMTSCCMADQTYTALSARDAGTLNWCLHPAAHPKALVRVAQQPQVAPSACKRIREEVAT